MLDFKEKLQLKREAQRLKAKEVDKAVPFPERMQAKRRRREIIAELKGESIGSVSDDIIIKYKAGDYNEQTPEQFRKTMQLVADAGLPIEEVGEGMIAWFKANPEHNNANLMLEGITQQEIDDKANQAATSPQNNLPEPTEAQKERGNYKKGHLRLGGLDISIENPKGSFRKGVAPDGTEWESKMHHHYGDIKRTKGADDDPVDVFIGKDTNDIKSVYVVDQIDPNTKKFDEHKVMMGFPSLKAAKQAYLMNYDQGWQGLKSIHEIGIDDFKVWLKRGDNKSPIGKYLASKNDLKRHQIMYN